ncbi:MAG: DUF429 domain-containing protein [Saprospiraceae bacterium]|nr:DUF429 domain-containing protein [Saprospiraceae bacterium]
MSNQEDEYIVGIDGCRSGWIAIVFQQGKWDFALRRDLAGFDQLHGGAQSILIDMPIGLIDQGEAGRACDRQARKHLSPYRHSSIFTPPCRKALYSHIEQASAVNFEYTGKKLSKQTINIIPKIREVDEFLLKLPTSRRLLFEEAHPELIFYGLNNKQPLLQSKKTKKGIQDRLTLLAEHFPKLKKLFHHILDKSMRKQVLPDDIVDAMSLAVAAVLKRRSPGNWQQFPVPTVYDSKGLPMQLGYYGSSY